jgi:predicted transposase YdaD
LYLEEFIAFFYPSLYQLIDWSKGYEWLDKELLSITSESMLGKQFVDKLAKVTLLGQNKPLFLHCEIQGRKEKAFPLRLSQYYNRILERYGYDQDILTLVVLTDHHSSWHPKQYQKKVCGLPTSILCFYSSKVLHYKDQKEILRKTQNLFGIVVLAHLAEMETKKDLKARLLSKLDLTRLLFSKGYNRDTVLEVLKFIDWLLVLPRKLALEYRSEVYQLEEEKKMGYTTTFEQFAREEGMKIGRKEGRQEGRKEGRQEGENKKALAIARSMQAKGFDVVLIEEMTGISAQEITDSNK